MQIVDCYRNVKEGEIITFGTYPQTSGGNDATPVKWRVLQNSGSELFILSEYILDCRRYHASRPVLHGTIGWILLGVTVICASG